MFRDEKNLKDPEGKSPTSYGAGSVGMSLTLSYTKTNKLITALYMVTDIIDSSEPLKNKLRTLGVEIISDINLMQSNYIGHPASSRARVKIGEIVSFLDIASYINIISEMNCNILRKEFTELNQSISELVADVKTFDHGVNIAELFKEEGISRFTVLKGHPSQDKGQEIYKGHSSPTRIGVQKGSTLLKALSDRTKHLSDKKSKSAQEFNVLKKQRREEVISSIKDNSGSATITDIKTKATGSLATCGEKTLQRELVSMVKDGVLNKTGEKRWSRYFIA